MYVVYAESGCCFTTRSLPSRCPSYIICRRCVATRSHQLKPGWCLHIRMVSDPRSRLLVVSTEAKRAGREEGGEGPQGMLEGVWSSGLRAVGQPPEGEAHGANSCHGEMLTPLNVQSSKQRWAEHMPMGEPGWGKVKRVNGAPQLTPWRKENWPLWNSLLKCGDHHSGGPKEDQSVRETQDSLWQTARGAGHKPQTGSQGFRRCFIGCT